MQSPSPASSEASYGSWSTPISAEMVVEAVAGLSDVQVDRTDGSIWWSESRPQEGGRVALLRWNAGTGEVSEPIPSQPSVRTRVHEYGGGAWWTKDDTVWYTNWEDQSLYRYTLGDDVPVQISRTPAGRHGRRYADGTVTPDGRWVICVRETHIEPDGRVLDTPRNEIVAIPAWAHGPTVATVLVSGADFVSCPRIDPTGNRLVWLAWNHPQMPWDGTELWTAELQMNGAAYELVGTHEDVLPLTEAELRVHQEDGKVETAAISLVGPRKLVGDTAEALVQPEWTRNGDLYVVSDRSNWWNLYKVGLLNGDLYPVAPTTGEIATPPWVFGQSRYLFSSKRKVVFAALARDGFDHLVAIDDGAIIEIPTRYTAWSSLRLDHSGNLIAIAASPTSEPAVVRLSWEDDLTAPTIEVIRKPRELGLPDEWISEPEPISFSSRDARVAHGLYYPPTNPTQRAPHGERPPLMVMVHGGPTSAARPQLSLATQFWTSRGFGVVDVNYGGSTGYGRQFRELLKDNWGVVDVEDCVAAAQYLVDQERVDAKRLVIRGGSAGGFTTLAALAFSDIFAAGASHYGVADLAALASDTHKFESRYLDGLVGPYPAARSVYAQRSPINHLDSFHSPLIVFQGLEDEIVPPNQAEMIVKALADRGVPVAYVPFEGEQHGFRQSVNIKRALEAELWFYGEMLGFTPADALSAVKIQGR